MLLVLSRLAGATSIRGIAIALLLLLSQPAATLSGEPLTALLSPGAYDLLNQRAVAGRSQFYVYRDADSGFNHGFPSGFLPNGQAKLSIDPACIDDPNAALGCSADPNRLDTVRGTVMQVSFGALANGEFAGLDFEEPQGFVSSHAGLGYDLTGATRILFSARSPTGITVRFGAGEQTTPTVTFPRSGTYTTVCVAVQGTAAQVCPADAGVKRDLLVPIGLSSVHVLFTVISDVPSSTGGVILIDDVRYDPLPASQATAFTLPLSTQTFGVIPAQQAPFPPDQANRNLATTYEASLSILALLARGSPADIAGGQTIADGLVYALSHDNGGDPLPVGAGGIAGLHNAYEAGDLALLNSQGPGAGQAGQIRLGGFSASQAGCGSTGYCLVLDGATGGNNAFAVLALLEAFKHTGNQTYLTAARNLAAWVYEKLQDTNGSGFGGYFLGYPDEGQPKLLQTGKSTENNADIFAAFTGLAQVETMLGNAAAATWTTRAKVAGDFVIAMFDASRGCFYAGTVPPGTASGAGIDPSGPQRGSDVVNRFDFLDANSFTWLAMAQSTAYRNAISWPAVVACIGQFQASVSAAGSTYTGYGLTRTPTSGPNGVAWEFTGQAAVVTRLSGGDPAAAIGNLRLAQASAPFGDGMGLAAATLSAGDTLPPISQCLNTPFQCIPERVGIAATAWAIFAERGYNPLAPSPLLAAVLPASRSVQVGVSATAFATIINTANTIASGCSIAPIGTLPASFAFQTTDPATNRLIGTANTPADVAANNGQQSFVFALTPIATISPQNVQFGFACANAAPAPVQTGLNTLLLSASTSPVPDVIALSATASADGILRLPGSTGSNAFAVATTNLGVGASIKIAPMLVPNTLPVALTICQTNPISAQCLAPRSGSVTVAINGNATPTFSIFATASDAIPLDPANSRIFVQFSDSDGVVRGSTSVAVATQ